MKLNSQEDSFPIFISARVYSSVSTSTFKFFMAFETRLMILTFCTFSDILLSR